MTRTRKSVLLQKMEKVVASQSATSFFFHRILVAEKKRSNLLHQRYTHTCTHIYTHTDTRYYTILSKNIHTICFTSRLSPSVTSCGCLLRRASWSPLWKQHPLVSERLWRIKKEDMHRRCMCVNLKNIILKHFSAESKKPQKKVFLLDPIN